MAVSKASAKAPANFSIFISSTYEDLKDYRAEVETRLQGLESKVTNMEHFGASNSTPRERCYEEISKCSLMILLIGVSYGSIEKESGLSFTELEYDFAREQGIPILAYIVDEDSPKIEIPIKAFDRDNQDRLRAFREKVSANHVVSSFSSIEDLGQRIAADVPIAFQKIDKSNSSKADSLSFASEVTDQDLVEGAMKFERFWLRPRSMAGKIYPVRLHLNKKWSGWKLKDELITSLGLTVGDTISTEVSVLMGGELIDDDGDTDLFADGMSADWLLDQCETAGRVKGCVIDCFVKFHYAKAPTGMNNKVIYKASLILVKGIRLVEVDDDPDSIPDIDINDPAISKFLSLLH